MSDIASQISQTPAIDHWNRIGIRDHHGICVPLFSLHSEKSGGIGEFPDLLPLFPWCRSLGIEIIQLLPLNDAGPDTSPYSAISAFALNPLHLSLWHLPDIDRYPQLHPLINVLSDLNALQRIDYPKVQSFKDNILQEYYRCIFPTIAKSQEYQSFLKENTWAEGYALFKAMKKQSNWQSWLEWPDEWKTPDGDIDKHLLQEFSAEVSLILFEQFLCFQQFDQVRSEAEKHGIMIKGDIPILISRESADVWQHQHLFHLNYSAGTPPDLYNPNGQDWGFPLYNWEAIEKQDYKWWKDRLDVASRFFDLYRLDHIVGFYRIWAIRLGQPCPLGQGNDLSGRGLDPSHPNFEKTPPLRGGSPNASPRREDDPNFQKSFLPENPEEWIKHGEKIMRVLLEHTDMLPIGEDLGVVPPEVRQNLRSLGICGTKVVRWERFWEEDKRFIPFEEYEPLSMTTVSTHDSDTLQLWWEKRPDESNAYAHFKGWDDTPHLSQKKHLEILYDSHHSSSLFHINLLQEYLALIPKMTWPDPEDERINVPGIISDRNWSYKFRPSVEEIINSEELRRSFEKIL